MKESIAIIATTEDMLQAYKHVLEDQQLNYPIYLARMNQALELARNLIDNDVQVIISWGRTAELLRKNISIPVISLRFIVQDYLNSIYRAFRHSDKVLVFSPNEEFQEIIPLLNKIFHSNIRSLTFEWQEPKDIDEMQDQVVETLREIRADGIDVVIGGIALERACRNNDLGLVYIKNLINETAILNTLREAAYSAQLANERVQRQSIRRILLDSVSEIALQIDPDGTISNYNQTASRYFGSGLSGKNICMIFPDFDLNTVLYESGSHQLILNSDRNAFTVEVRPLIIHDVPMGAIMIAQMVSALQTKEQSLRLALSQRGLTAKTHFEDLIYISERMQSLVERAKRFARSQSTVLIHGESGTGKELFAQSIHNSSFRANGPFVAINCGALPPALLESELFGYVKGAFTGASSKGKAGIFELAHRGTLFLDEIGEMPLELQVRLLRVIQEREVFRLGDDHMIPVDVRIIAATNKDLKESAAHGSFRADLYYRLSVLELELPALRERPEDIPMLAQHFAALNSEKKLVRLEGDLLQYLSGFSWPGNIRQLQNVVEQLCVMSDGETIRLSEAIKCYDFGLLMPKQTDNSKHKDLFPSQNISGVQSSYNSQDEATEIMEALRQCRGSRKKAAELLGISSATLWRHMKSLEKTNPDIFTANYKIHT